MLLNFALLCGAVAIYAICSQCLIRPVPETNPYWV